MIKARLRWCLISKIKYEKILIFFVECSGYGEALNFLNKNTACAVFLENSWLREMDLFRFASLAADFCLWQTGAFQSPNPCTEPPCLGGSNPTQHTYLTKKHPQGMSFVKSWLREMDLNHRPSGYEPDELPGCSIPR